MKSMTGFGRGAAEVDGLSCTVEVKSVNARYCDIFIKSNARLGACEQDLRQTVQSFVHRGKVDIFVTLQHVGDRKRTITVNRTLKEQAQDLLVAEGFYPSPAEVPLSAVMQIAPDWIQHHDMEEDDSTLTAVLQEAASKALIQLTTMRETEGANIKSDLTARLDTLKYTVDAIDGRKQKAIDAYSNHLRERIQELLENVEVEFNEERFVQEVALLADKTDITEEIVRFRSHVIQLRNTLAQSNPIGRKLDFIIQEMNREVNTMGSKASDGTITDYVVKLKCELEKIREQIQNVE
ncbi:MAG: YicC family protein [Veillonella sp.]|nr:YicC family protein [Veillonella sp.]